MNIKKITFSLITLIILTLSFVTPLDSHTKNNLQNVLIIYSSEDPFCGDVLKNTEFVLDKNNIFYTDFDLSDNYTVPVLDNFPIVAIATESIYYLSKGPQKDLKEYVKNGGRVVQLLRGYSSETAEMFGIANTSTPSLIEPVKGIKFEANLIPGLKGLKIPPEICENVSYAVSLSGGVSIIARAFNGLPLAWKNTYGLGETIFWNVTFLSEKAYRGLIIGSITSLLPISVRRVLGFGVIYIDDIPSPSWRAKLEPIKSEYDMTDTEYYFKILLPDLLGLAKTYNLKYTTATIFSYNNLIKPPFSFFDWDNTTLLKEDGTKIVVPEETFKILKNERTEIGFHGYNHIPFTIAEWKSQVNMKKAVEASREKWFSISKEPPRIYVPPMNINDREGFDTVMEVFPEIEIYSSLYYGYQEEGCGREFGPEPWNKRIISIPRVTAGYILGDYEKFLAISTIEAFGIWTHFLHPDDIFSTPENYPNADPEWIRNPDSLSWRGDKKGKNGLYYKLESGIKAIKTSYPWLSFETAKNIKDDIMNYNNESDSIRVYNDFIELNAYKETVYVVELPLLLTLEKDENFTILSNEISGNKRKMVIKVKNGCRIYFEAS